MNKTKVKLQCLEYALKSPSPDSNNTVNTAQKYYDFVSKKEKRHAS